MIISLELELNFELTLSITPQPKYSLYLVHLDLGIPSLAKVYILIAFILHNQHFLQTLQCEKINKKIYFFLPIEI